MNSYMVYRFILLSQQTKRQNEMLNFINKTCFWESVQLMQSVVLRLS